MSIILDGKATAKEVRARVKEGSSALMASAGFAPGLAVVGEQQFVRVAVSGAIVFNTVGNGLDIRRVIVVLADKAQFR